MTDQLDLFLIGWLFFLLIGSWVLINALIDMSAKHVRRWFAVRWEAQARTAHRIAHRNRAGR